MAGLFFFEFYTNYLKYILLKSNLCDIISYNYFIEHLKDKE